MQIQLFGAASAEIGGSPDTTKNAGQSGAAQAAELSAPQDTATLSSGGASVESLSQQALQIASIMESRVLALREAVNNGQYGLEPNEIADAMLSDGV
jgi:flagellar biosynthesis anti-sigma factor FlgM